MSLVKVRIPGSFSGATVARNRSWFSRTWPRTGVTSVQDYSEWGRFSGLPGAEGAGKLTVRITEWLPFNLPVDELQNMRVQGWHQRPLAENRCTKAFTDGPSVRAPPRCWSLYSDDPSTTGILTNDPEKLTAMAISATSSVFSSPFHSHRRPRQSHRSRRFRSRLPKPTASATAAIASSTPKWLPPWTSHVSPSFMSLLPCSLLIRPPTCAGPRIASAASASWRLCLGHLGESGARLAFGTITTSSPSVRFAACTPASRANARWRPEKNGWEPQEKIPLED